MIFENDGSRLERRDSRAVARRVDGAEARLRDAERRARCSAGARRRRRRARDARATATRDRDRATRDDDAEGGARINI